MGVLIMGRQRFNIVIPFFRNQDLVLFQKLPCLFLRQHLFQALLVLRPFRERTQREQAAVVDQPQHIRVQVLPRPVKPCELTEHGVPGTDVVSGVVPGKSDGILPFPSHVKRQVHGIIRHRTRFMTGNEYLDIRFLIHMSSLKTGRHPAGPSLSSFF